MATLEIWLLMQFAMLAGGVGAVLSPQNGAQIEDIRSKMKAAYAKVEDYQTETEVKVYNEDQRPETERFRYTFKKPNHIRIDMESPYPGMILVYPDKEGKVTVRPGGLARFLKLHLAPGSTLFRISAGQRIDQTDLGLLIQNIAHSLTDQRRGEIKLSRGDGLILIEVLAEDHFLKGVLTLYHFSIDETSWLPVKVGEYTPDGVLKREVVFHNLRTSIGIPDSFFSVSGENEGDGQSGE